MYSDSFFTTKITGAEIDEKLVNVRLNGDYSDTFRIKTQDIEGYMMKGMWYFDKRLGELKYMVRGVKMSFHKKPLVTFLSNFGNRMNKLLKT